MSARFAGIALGHVTREYPHKLDHVLASTEDARASSALHPIFYGSFDWHSCVHGYWLLARLLLRFPTAPFATEIAGLFDRQLTPEKVAGERHYLVAWCPPRMAAAGGEPTLRLAEPWIANTQMSLESGQIFVTTA